MVIAKCSLSHQNKSPCFQNNNLTLVSSASTYYPKGLSLLNSLHNKSVVRKSYKQNWCRLLERSIHFSDKFSVSLGNVTCRELRFGAGPALPLPPTSSTSKTLSESCPCEESEVSDIRRVLSDVLSVWLRPMPGTPGSKFLPPRLFSLRSGM